MVMVDDSHATGFVGENGRGTPELFGVQARVDVVTSTMGKALGGAAGGFTSGRKGGRRFIEALAALSLFQLARALDRVSPRTGSSILSTTSEHRLRLLDNTAYFRKEMSSRGFEIVEGTHPIVPVMLGDARLAQNIAKDMLDEGIYVVGFSYPVVPKGQARIRVQLSAAHTREQVVQAIEAFTRVGKKHAVI